MVKFRTKLDIKVLIPVFLWRKILKAIFMVLKTQFSSVQLLSSIWLFATTWTAAYQASLSIAKSWSLLKLMSIESVMPSNHLIFCCPLLLLPLIFPSIRDFSNEAILHISGQSIGVSASASVLTMNMRTDFL